MMSVIIILTLLLDQLTKLLAGKFLLPGESVPIIKGIFHLTLVHNRGAAFGIFKNQLWLFIFSALLASFLIIAELKSREKRPAVYDFSLALILAGALGNLIDRILLGHVVDFLDFRVWPVFNIADSAITVGAALLAYSIIKKK